MKITIKNLQGKTFPIEVAEDATVAQVKEIAEKEHQIPAATAKLIMKGKIMEDEKEGVAQTLKDYNIQDGGFIVVMSQKPKPKPAAKPEEAKAEEEPKSATQPGVSLVAPANPTAVIAAQPTPATQPPAQTQAPAQTQPAAQAQAQAQQQLAAQGPPVDEGQVNDLMAISGKPREMVVQALQVAFGDPDRAFQYLMDGMPQMAPQMGNPGAGAGAGAGGNPMAGMMPPGMDAGADYGDEAGDGADLGGDGTGLAALQAFANNPAFIPLRQRMIQNPQFYTEFMSMLQNEQPQLYAVIQQNPMAFMNLMMGGNVNAAGAGGAGAGAGAMPGMPGMPGAGGAAAGGQPRPPPGSIQVTAQEMEAVKRLESLGFSQNRAVQAYFACDKNEEHAANFLFDSVGDDENDAFQAAVQASTGNPVQEAPAQSQPAEAQPAQAQPAEVQPAQAQPAEAQPVQVPQVEAQPAEAQPVEAQPAQAEANPAAGGDVEMADDNAATNQNQNNGGNEPDAGAGAGGAGGDQVEKSAFE